MPHYVYVIYSPSLDRFYTGETVSVEERVKQHNFGYYAGSSTKITTDWQLFLKIECTSRNTALLLERYIKKMKSRKFYMKLKETPGLAAEIISRLK